LLPVSDITGAIGIGAVAASGGVSAAVDLWSRRIPNSLTLGVATLGLVLAFLHATPVTVPGALAGFALGLVLMLPGHLIGATGAGDVKLFAAIGTLLGPSATLAAFVYTAIAGGILALLVAVRRRRLAETMERTAILVTTGGSNVAEIERPSADNRFAYAPAIAVGALAAALGL
jgi:prepilin peptidase CpaA